MHRTWRGNLRDAGCHADGGDAARLRAHDVALRSAAIADGGIQHKLRHLRGWPALLRSWTGTDPCSCAGMHRELSEPTMFRRVAHLKTLPDLILLICSFWVACTSAICPMLWCLAKAMLKANRSPSTSSEGVGSRARLRALAAAGGAADDEHAVRGQRGLHRARMRRRRQPGARCTHRRRPPVRLPLALPGLHPRGDAGSHPSSLSRTGSTHYGTGYGLVPSN